MESNAQNHYLPGSRKEMDALGWKQADIILFSGDAYVDHPSFGSAVIGRMLESAGYRVALVPQPNWQDDLRDFKKLGAPLLFFGVSAGNMDSMINHYTAARRLRHDDAYTPGNRHGARPDYPSLVYTKILKSLFPEVPVVLGGIEASLRRFTHFDYWQNKLKPGILKDSGADYLFYGMAEYPIVYFADALAQKKDITELHDIPNMQYLAKGIPIDTEHELLAPHEICLHDKDAFSSNFVKIERNANALEGKTLIQPIEQAYLITNPTIPLLSTKKLDKIYSLPFTRTAHPRYQNKAPIPAYEMIRHSINIHRGCFGACAFCTIAAHQGRFISSRSEKSIMKEVEKLTKMEDFKGHISDLGGPSANMYAMQPINLNQCRICKRASCIYPGICDNLNTDHTPLTKLYERVRNHQAVKKVTIGSGIRYDLILKAGKNYRASAGNYLEQLIRFHVSGRLKVAPEHSEDKVLKIMRKPSFELYERLQKTFDKINKKHQLNQQLIPYFISSHPGCSYSDMQELSKKVKAGNIITEHAQDFTPTPMTLATVMYYTGKDPYTGKSIEITSSLKEKAAQRNILKVKYKKQTKKRKK
ncbi:MAG: YgiQ family radical SAM protein [Bacteroidota bacterium]|nr:YgiQ family radical SAM protein [Bacteroidota bacterium]